MMSTTNALILRIFFMSGAIGAALLAQSKGWGLLNLTVWPEWVELVVAILVLDLVVYGQHVLFHTIPMLWCLHKVHHSDIELDVTTGVRFHPGEIIISMFIKIGTILVIGASPSTVLIFEVLLNATAMFNHSNVRMPLRLDRMLRWIVVTPDMHCIHHSVITEETDRNFGFNLSVWDRVFGTYQHQPLLGHEYMTIGLEHYRDPIQLTWLRLLALPFLEEPSLYQFRPAPNPQIGSTGEENPIKKTVKTEEKVLT